MTLEDILKALGIKIDVALFKEGDHSTQIHIQTLNIVYSHANNNPVFNDPNTLTPSINLAALGPEKAKQLLDELPKILQSDKSVVGIVDQNANKETSKLLPFDQKFTSSQLFKDIKILVPPDDHNLLKAAYYIKELDLAGNYKEVREKKNEIGIKHGQKGNNIINLCRQNYFETSIIPVLKKMKDSGESQEKIFEMYEFLVRRAAFVLFVNGRDLYEMQLADALENIRFVLRYGGKETTIHAIGNLQVSYGRRMLEDIKSQFGEKNVKFNYSRNEDQILDVQIIFKTIDATA